MKRIASDVGGRPPANDDFLALQSLILQGSGGPLLAGFGTCVVSGCQVTPAGQLYNVAPGIVWLGDGLYDFPGAAAVPMPGSFLLGALEVIDEREYETAGTLPAITEQRAVLDVHDGDGTPVIDSDGPIMWYERVLAKTRALGAVEFGFFDLSGYDNTGRGRGANRGWALVNGNNGTNADALGRVPLFQNPNRTDYDSAGKKGGAETVTLTPQQMPAHTHEAEAAGAHKHGLDTPAADPGAVGSGNALAKSNTVNGGVYTVETGEQPAHTHTIKEAGGGQPHNNMPPYIVLAARQWIGL
ncbi:phage baseplate protein [Hymenobacter sp. B81]|uniref:phage baseplate protein n=1 Tax=Hymenobacter sp. B81 TaxID=3344878 RepID=UPI0037DCDECD